ncbi:NLP/P60 protein [Paenibacillus curdlanolyticus YK9]|uniref:NLP/P60 protein n=1 Tax=Paenibacillus curdlanolyticus YK9 TaxID=717606 RepID=E0IAT5_9BACL|nr:NlpC/P60 family protein [Paenibacillus curdlanolyticus]EFM10489.1 NLP/P60 protein [Paenibacillus curdlanolyticus YK9]
MFKSSGLAKMSLLLALALAMLTIGGCGGGHRANRETGTGMKQRTASLMVAGRTNVYRVPVYEEAGGRVWIPIAEAVRPMGLKLHEANGITAIGDTDVAYVVRTDSSQALAGDNPIVLPQAPRQLGNKLYLTRQSLARLFGTNVDWDRKLYRLNVEALDDREMLNDAKGRVTAKGMVDAKSETMEPLAAPPDVDEHAMVEYAKGFLGTPYQFGADAYEQSRRFDCSSFTRHVFDHFGIDLPRSSRAQSQLGSTVEENDLRPGDLMFFYTPNRYESNKIVGHVGLYAGNGKFIQTYGDPGVVVSDFNAYWQGRFLFGKRVSQ